MTSDHRFTENCKKMHDPEAQISNAQPLWLHMTCDDKTDDPST
ncbi:MAG: hypothetical protein WCJ02_09735 [bacterium]